MDEFPGADRTPGSIRKKSLAPDSGQSMPTIFRRVLAMIGLWLRQPGYRRYWSERLHAAVRRQGWVATVRAALRRILRSVVAG